MTDLDRAVHLRRLTRAALGYYDELPTRETERHLRRLNREADTAYAALAPHDSAAYLQWVRSEP